MLILIVNIRLQNFFWHVTCSFDIYIDCFIISKTIGSFHIKLPKHCFARLFEGTKEEKILAGTVFSHYYKSATLQQEYAVELPIKYQPNLPSISLTLRDSVINDWRG